LSGYSCSGQGLTISYFRFHIEGLFSGLGFLGFYDFCIAPHLRGSLLVSAEAHV
jgi:hypothetical protein